MPAATAAALPPEDPPGDSDRSHGFRVTPKRVFSVTGRSPSSGGFVLPMTIAPASRIWGPDHTTERLELAREIPELGYRSGDPELALQGRNWRVADLFEAGDGPGVRAEVDAYATLAAEARLPAYSWWVPVWGATLALIDGRVAEGMELSRRARELGRRAGDPNAVVITAQHELMRTTISERFAELDPVALASGHPASQRSRRGPAWRAYRLTFAWLHAERGELEASRRNLAAALDGGLAAVPRDANWLASIASAAQACAAPAPASSAQSPLAISAVGDSGPA
jgi:hypothetical protein